VVARVDFAGDYELAGLLAKHFGGALPFERLEGMTRRRMLWYYARYERQAVEEEIRNEYLYPPPPAKARTLPSPARMAALVDERIAKYHASEAGK
jgi:hypothetical protein